MSSLIKLKRATYAEIEARYSCEHNDRQLRHRIIADGRPTYVTQCLVCGHTSNPIKKQKALELAGGKDIPPYDNLLHPKWHASKSAEYFAAYLMIRPALAAEYATYLASDKWQELRASVMSRSQGQCELCEERSADDVHHLTYQSIGNEKLEELIAVCRECHSAIHGKEDVRDR